MHTAGEFTIMLIKQEERKLPFHFIISANSSDIKITMKLL